jgi:hypothetical protein
VNRYEHRRPYWRDEGPDQELEEFQERHRSLSDRVERFLMQLVILGLVSLVLVQTLHMNTSFRQMVNLVEGLEGVPWEQVTAWSNLPLTAQAPQPVTTPNTGAEVAPVSSTVKTVSITVSLMSHRSADQVRLLLDGESVGDFRSGRITTPVKAGQVLVIDANRSPEPMTFRVVGATGLSSPALGKNLTTRGDRQTLGVVRLTN